MEHPDIFTSYLRLSQHMSQLFRAHFGRLDLTFPQALVLTALGDGDPVPISTLAERTGSANSTVSGIVDRLEKLGLAKRERSELDRRVFRFPAPRHVRGRSEPDRHRPGQAGRGPGPGRGKGALNRRTTN